MQLKYIAGLNPFFFLVITVVFSSFFLLRPLFLFPFLSIASPDETGKPSGSIVLYLALNLENGTEFRERKGFHPFPTRTPFFGLVFLHLISPWRSSGHHRWRWRWNNTFPPFPVFRCPQVISRLHWCYLPISSSVFLSFLLLSLSRLLWL